MPECVNVLLCILTGVFCVLYVWHICRRLMLLLLLSGGGVGTWMGYLEHHY